MLIEFCVHGHFYREEGNTNGVYGAWWAPLDLLTDKVGKEAMKMLSADLFERAQTDVREIFVDQYALSTFPWSLRFFFLRRLGGPNKKGDQRRHKRRCSRRPAWGSRQTPLQARRTPRR